MNKQWISGFAIGILLSFLSFTIYQKRNLVTFNQPYSLMVEDLTVEILKKCGADDNCMDISQVRK